MSRSHEALFSALHQARDRIVLREGDRRLDGGQVLELVHTRSAQLQRHACRRVAIALDNGIDWVLWDLAILEAGCVCVPLPAFFSSAQTRHVLDRAGVDCVIAADIEPWRKAGFVIIDDALACRAVGGAAKLPAGTRKITYTSGTTGAPKGVCLDTATQIKVADSLRLATASCGVTRHLCALPLSILLENIAGLYAPLLAGAEIELVPAQEIGFGGANRFDIARFLATLARCRPHSLILMPQMLQALVTAMEGGVVGPDSLRFVAVGGARVSPQLLERAEALGLPVFEGYGLSECASVVCLNTPAARRIGSVGRPLPHCEIWLAADGEVMVRGPRMLGYAGEDPLAQDWLPTGDLGHFDDGYLVLHGRKKHQFITAWGRNVNPEWVEAELAQQAPIAQAWLHGEALPENLAVIVPQRDDIPDSTIDAAVALVNRDLPGYMRVHRWVRAAEAFTPGNGLATANGRLCRDALAEHYRSAIHPFESFTAHPGETV